MKRSFLPSRKAVIEGTPYYEDADMGERYPALYELLCSSQSADGKGRLPASLSLFAEGGRLKACISDRTTNMVWFVTLKGCEDVLGQIEQALERDAGEWRPKKAR